MGLSYLCVILQWFFVVLVWTKQTQNERDDNCTHIQENDKIRSQNKAMREALQNVICSTCDEQKLRIENARLKEEVRKSLIQYPVMQKNYVCIHS